ncbi:Charged multivesicular body protein 6 [Talaromyces islandicus]|uniref:Charged multivesicular body protein 6 n=1 Tax=Talaromyces islandicus TaxID=28573 RepID=A0A0U1LQ05_TALIS|nr:Charged multivesicular body protein 6 [Talaromyces islandicus]
MGNTNSSHKISGQDRAILDLKIQRDKLHQYQKRIAVLTDRETAVAKECLARNDRNRALLALRRKKYQESLLAKTDAQLAQLEQLVSQVEFALVQKDILYGLQQGTQVLQAINKEMGGLAAVEKLMGESEEARAYQEEVSQMLAGQMSNEDEDEVEDELEALQREVEGPVVLPNAPEAPPVISEDEKKQRAKERAKARAEAMLTA